MANFQYLAPSGVIIEAIQFKAEDQDLTRAWPRWFIDLLIDGNIQRNMHEKKWYLNRTHVIDNGDWIVRVEDDIVLCSDHYFTQMYQEVTRIG